MRQRPPTNERPCPCPSPRILIVLLAFALTVLAPATGSVAAAPETAEASSQSTVAATDDTMPLSEAFQHVAGRFTSFDWIVIVAYLALTTLLGALLAGRQATIRDFFLGGRKLPWPAVCGSIIATELSAATFLIAPAIVFKADGNLTYIQLAIGTILARFIIGYFFVPAFYEREIYSPYDYMGHRLGNRVRNLSTALFMIGAILAQGARVYIAALALQVVTGVDIRISIVIIGAVSILWTWIGGIRTVIWTDVLQFLLFTIGAGVALVFVVRAIDGGLAQVVRESYEAGKLRVLDTSLDPHKAYTLWCGLFATGWLTLASHGTDQLNAQRMFTCRGPAEARKAIIWSSASQVLTLLLLLVGAAIWVYHQHRPLDVAPATVIGDDPNRVFAVFVVDVLPRGVSGLLMAGVFAAAISTLDSVLAALSQSTLATIYKPLRKRPTTARHEVAVSRLFVVFWGVVMTAFAIFCHTIQRHYGDLIQFALAMAAYTYGALLGTFLLALLPTQRDDLGLLWGVPLSMLTVFILTWSGAGSRLIVVPACFLLAASAVWRLRRQPAKIVIILICVSLILLLHTRFTLAWPWHFPIGTAVTFLIGYAVGNRKPGGTKMA